MTTARTLRRYIARRFLMTIIGTFLLCSILIFMIDLVELLRQSGKFGSVRAGRLIWMGLLLSHSRAGLMASMAGVAIVLVHYRRTRASGEMSIDRPPAGHSTPAVGGPFQCCKQSLGLNVGAPLYDSGRIASLTGWRTSLSEAARQGQLTAQDQVAFQTVSLALERSRYRQQARVYQQFARKMACLVDVLDQIVKADRGRASELVQARKTLAQAELSQSQSISQVRQAETRLKRFIGDGMPSSEGVTALLLDVPPLVDMEAQAARASEIAQLEAQAKALESFSRAAVAAQKPQLNWVLTGSKAGGGNRPGTLLAGVSFSMPLLNEGADYGIDAAKKRAEAARLQSRDALEARRSRIAEVHEQAASSFDRARQTSAIVRDSNQVRNFTLQQWQQLARRSLFDVMSAESEHYNLRVAYILRRVAFRNLDVKKSFEPIGVFRFLSIRTRHGKPQIAQNLGNSAHADAADSDEMNSLYVPKHFA